MAEIPINQPEIDNLGRQLEMTIMGDNERVLLAGLLAVAAKALRREAPEDPVEPHVVHDEGPASYPESAVVVEVLEPLPTLQEQVAGAFTPGAIDERADADVDNVKVGHVIRVRVRRG
jgi:hypothetical protein